MEAIWADTLGKLRNIPLEYRKSWENWKTRQEKEKPMNRDRYEPHTNAEALVVKTWVDSSDCLLSRETPENQFTALIFRDASRYHECSQNSPVQFQFQTCA